MKNKVPVKIEIPEGTRDEIVESFKQNLLSVLSNGVNTPVQKYIRPTAAATRLGVSRPTIYKMMNTGILKTHKLMGSRLILVTELDQLVESNG